MPDQPRTQPCISVRALFGMRAPIDRTGIEGRLYSLSYRTQQWQLEDAVKRFCRYVTEGAFVESGMVMGLSGPSLQNIDLLVRARLALYAPGQHMAKELSKNPTVLVVNDTAFAHGGLLPMHIKYGLEKINAEVAAWMRADVVEGGGFAPPPFIAMGDSKAIMWNRTFGKEKWISPIDRLHAMQLLDNALTEIDCKRLVVGHTPQMMGANCECDGRVWRLDVGMSSGMLDAEPCVLEIFTNSDGESVPRLLTNESPKFAFPPL